MLHNELRALLGASLLYLQFFPRSSNPVMYDDILGYCHNAGFSPKGIIETAPRSTAIGLVNARQGVATIAESLKQSRITGTAYRPLKGKGPKFDYSAITHKDVSGRWIELLKIYIADALSVNKSFNKQELQQIRVNGYEI